MLSACSVTSSSTYQLLVGRSSTCTGTVGLLAAVLRLLVVICLFSRDCVSSLLLATGVTWLT